MFNFKTYFSNKLILLRCQSQILMSGLSTRVNTCTKSIFDFLQFFQGGALTSICGGWGHSPPVYLLFGAV